MKKNQTKNLILVAIGMAIFWKFFKPKEAKAEEIVEEMPEEEIPTETEPISALPPGWYVAEIVPLQKELAQLKLDLEALSQEFQ